jgi:hypothetical protein
LESKVILVSLAVHRLLARSIVEGGGVIVGRENFDELFIDLGLGQAGIRSFQHLLALVVMELVASHSFC